MNKGVLALCGNDSAYIKRMYEYVLKELESDYSVFLFTESKAFKTFLKSTKADITLMEEDFEYGENKNIVKKIFLSEENKESAIYKYQSCDRILKEILSMCVAEGVKEDTDKENEGCRLIGVYTPVKRCFQTTFALTLGQILAKEKKVLYLNFECFSGFETMCRSIEQTDLLDLVYFSECNEAGLSMRIDAMKEKIGNLDYVSPVKTYLKYSEVSREQWKKLLVNLLKKTDYEYIILDLSEQVNGLLDILKMCSHIYTLMDEDRAAAAKVAQYENLLRAYAYEEILDKTENLKIPRFKEIPKDFEMLPYSELADYIRKILNFESGDENE